MADQMAIFIEGTRDGYNLAQIDRYGGGTLTVEELIELSRPQCLGLHLLTEQELEWMIEGINDGLNAIEKAYLYFDDEEEQK